MKLINKILSLLITTSFLFPISTSKQILVSVPKPNHNLAPGTQTPTPLNLTPAGAPKKYIYAFWGGQAEGNKDMKELLGGKGAGLAEMVSLGLPVPPGFTITTEATNEFFKLQHQFAPGLMNEIEAYLAGLEKVTGKKFGDPENPLLVAVRSGAKISMPGMMETILNVGLNDEIVEEFAKKTGNPRMAWDSYRRLIQMFGGTVFEIKKSFFDDVIKEIKSNKGVIEDTDLDVEDLKEIVQKFKGILIQYSGKAFPQDPKDQLVLAIHAVFHSSFGDKAKEYRKAEGISDDVVSAVTVIAMVFGNWGENSGTAVLFTRDPNTGEKVPYGNYLDNAQGEDVVAGIRNTIPVVTLEEKMPQVWKQIKKNIEILERHFKDMQDTEFTIENGKFYLLQTRTGKRMGLASFQIAVDLVNEGLIDKETALLQIKPEHVEQMLYKYFDPEDKKRAIEKEDRLLAKAEGAVPAAASGVIAFTPERVVELVEQAKKEGKKDFQVILVRPETSPEDVAGMKAAAGILTGVGGQTSHAAVVARGWGKCCIVGAKDSIHFELDENHNPVSITVKGKTLREGDTISLDGATGEVILGSLKAIDSDVVLAMTHDEDIAQIKDEAARKLMRVRRDQARESKRYKLFKTVMEWVQEACTKGVDTPDGGKRILQVRANCDEPRDARLARAFGAEGIGLVRTEHMFFKEERINVFRRMILARNDKERKTALDRLQEFYEDDFYHMLKAMDGYPVIVRLLDPPLHEFLPNSDEKIEKFAIEAIAEENGVAPTVVENTLKKQGVSSLFKRYLRRLPFMHRIAKYFDDALELQIAEAFKNKVELVRKNIAELAEANPMIGYRGVRLGIVDEAISAMQFRAVIKAKMKLAREDFHPHPEIEIPFVGDIQELRLMREIFDQERKNLKAHFSEFKLDGEPKQKFEAVFDIPFGTMIETPRAVVMAGELAELADFISFGTNDLTQMTWALSRDDYAKFLKHYLEKRIWKKDPFVSLDKKGVGKFVQMTVEAARKVKPKIDIGVCGEHGGDPESIEFFFDAGLDNVSPSTMRVPVALLAAAQKSIKERKKLSEARQKATNVSLQAGTDTIIFTPDDPRYFQAKRLEQERLRIEAEIHALAREARSFSNSI